jgi:hypothetical protein
MIAWYANRTAASERIKNPSPITHISPADSDRIGANTAPNTSKARTIAAVGTTPSGTRKGKKYDFPCNGLAQGVPSVHGPRATPIMTAQPQLDEMAALMPPTSRAEGVSKRRDVTKEQQLAIQNDGMYATA